ncbi:MAG: hypothetical protein WDN10_00790 [bacterium]
MRLVLFILFLLFTTPVLAASLPAGFQPGTLWISKTTLGDGDSAAFYTVVYNSSAASLSGDVVFRLDGGTLGTKHFNLGPGTTQVLSLPWTAKTGEHRAVASIENASAEGALSTTNTLTLTVAPPPPPSPVVAAASAAADTIAANAPAVKAAAGTTLGTVRAVRQSAIDTIGRAIARSSGPAASGEILGTSTQKTVPVPQDSGWKKGQAARGILGTIGSAWTGVLHGALVVFQSDILFWIAFVAILYVLFRVVLLMFRERRRKNRP